MCLATAVDQISWTCSIVSGIHLRKQKVSPPAAKKSIGSVKIPDQLTRRCPVCSYENYSWTTFCSNCGERLDNKR